MPFRPAQRSEFSRAPLHASPSRDPAQRGAIIGVAFFASFFGEAKKEVVRWDEHPAWS